MLSSMYVPIPRMHFACKVSLIVNSSMAYVLVLSTSTKHFIVSRSYDLDSVVLLRDLSLQIHDRDEVQKEIIAPRTSKQSLIADGTYCTDN